MAVTGGLSFGISLRTVLFLNHFHDKSATAVALLLLRSYSFKGIRNKTELYRADIYFPS